jgi:hypothetical protein
MGGVGSAESAVTRDLAGTRSPALLLRWVNAWGPQGSREAKLGEGSFASGGVGEGAKGKACKSQFSVSNDVFHMVFNAAQYIYSTVFS